MDYNSPIYREKYLKYKKKYISLKKIEYTQTGGLFGSNPTKKYNSQMQTLFKGKIIEADNVINNFLKVKVDKGKQKNLDYISAKQIEEVKKEYKDMIKTIKDIINENTDIKPNDSNPEPNLRLNEILSSKLGEGISLKEWAFGKDAADGKVKDATDGKVKDASQDGGAGGVILEKLLEIHTQLQSDIKSQDWLKENIKDDTTKDNLVKEIGMLNRQLDNEKLCEELLKKSTLEKGTKVEDCSKEKSQAFEKIISLLVKINITSKAHLNKIEKAENNWNKAQAALNQLSDKFLILAGDLGKAPKDPNKATIEEVKELQKKAILNYKNKMNTELGLKVADGEEVTKDNILKHLVLPEVKIEEETISKLEQMLKSKTVGEVSPTSSTESPSKEAIEKVKIDTKDKEV